MFLEFYAKLKKWFIFTNFPSDANRLYKIIVNVIYQWMGFFNILVARFMVIFNF
jgi:hypothetical protein